VLLTNKQTNADENVTPFAEVITRRNQSIAVTVYNKQSLCNSFQKQQALYIKFTPRKTPVIVYVKSCNCIIYL